jgi:hypothetical protein
MSQEHRGPQAGTGAVSNLEPQAITGAADNDTRIAPDPFAAVLPALAALGAIASTAAVNWVAHERTPERARSKRKPGVALRDLESCCLRLQEVFRRFHHHPKLFAGEGGPAASPLKFGVHGPRVSPDAARAYQQIVSDVASMLVLATQNSFDVMAAIEDGEIEAPEEVFFGFGEQQERLNRLLAQRVTLKAAVGLGLDIADKLTGLVRQLRRRREDR